MAAELQQALEAAHDAAEAKRKRLATLTAQLALRGFELHVTAEGTHIVRRWAGLTRTFDSLDDVQQFAAQVGATA